jgi:hypothetical protein
MRVAWSAVGLVLVISASACGDDTDDGERGETGGRGGVGGSAGSGNASALEQLTLSCQRLCGILLWVDDCVEGEFWSRGKKLEDGEEPSGEAPLSEDQDCVVPCVSASQIAPEYECWQQAAAFNNCLSETVWFCDAPGNIGTNECNSLGVMCDE